MDEQSPPTQQDTMRRWFNEAPMSTQSQNLNSVYGAPVSSQVMPSGQMSTGQRFDAGQPNNPLSFMDRLGVSNSPTGVLMNGKPVETGIYGNRRMGNNGAYEYWGNRPAPRTQATPPIKPNTKQSALGTNMFSDGGIGNFATKIGNSFVMNDGTGSISW